MSDEAAFLPQTKTQNTERHRLETMPSTTAYGYGFDLARMHPRWFSASAFSDFMLSFVQCFDPWF